MLEGLHLHGTIRTGRLALIAGTDVLSVRTAKAREPRGDCEKWKPTKHLILQRQFNGKGVEVGQDSR